MYSEVDDTSDDKGEINQKKKLDEEQMIDDKKTEDLFKNVSEREA